MNYPVRIIIILIIKYIKILYYLLSGAYVPLTTDGNIVVDQILASCYASFDHDLAHMMMTPMQWNPEIIEFIFGVNNKYSGYVYIAKEFGRWLLPYRLLFERSNVCALHQLQQEQYEKIEEIMLTFWTC